MPDVHAAACKRLVLVHTAFFFFLSPGPSDSADLDGRWPSRLLTLPLVTDQLWVHQPPRGGERTRGWRPVFGNQGWAGDFMAPQKKA